MLTFLLYLILRFSGARLGKAAYYIPIFGSCARDYNLSYFCRTLAIFLRRLKTLPEALDLTAGAIPNIEYALSAHNTLINVQKGRALSDSLSRGILFPATAQLLIRSGELSGNLDENLERAANFYHTSYIKKTQIIRRLTLPLIVIWVGIIVGIYGYVVFSLLTKVMSSLI